MEVKAPLEADPIALARLAASGDTEATARVLRLVAPEVLRVVRGVMGPYSADVDDAVQQALIALIHALPSFRGECAPQGYACRIAFRTALSVRKRAHRGERRRAGEIAADELVAGAEPRIDDATRRTELLRSLLEDIPQEQARRRRSRSEPCSVTHLTR